MRADALTPGHEYAYVDPDFPGHPLHATVLTPADDGVVKVEVRHPDVGREEMTVATRTIAGRWTDKARDSGDATWEQMATEAYALVGRQRALAERLRQATGIIREPSSYAGRGGAGRNTLHTRLQLNFDEWDEVLSRIENGGAYAPRPISEDVPA